MWFGGRFDLSGLRVYQDYANIDDPKIREKTIFCLRVGGIYLHFLSSSAVSANRKSILLNWLGETLRGAVGLLERAAGIWFVSWAIRRGGEFDYKLNWVGKLVRWAVVLLAFSLSVVFSRLGKDLYRLVALFVGLAFLVWPNFAYHLTKFFHPQGGSASCT
jgi:hypothetical protein